MYKVEFCKKASFEGRRGGRVGVYLQSLVLKRIRLYVIFHERRGVRGVSPLYSNTTFELK